MTRLIQALAVAAMLASTSASAEQMQLVINGQTRTFLVERPAAQGPRPTVLMLHEAGGTAAGIARASGLMPIAAQRGFAAVFPQGLAGSRWNFYAPGKETAGFIEMSRQVGGIPDDVAFVKRVIADLVRRGIADPKRLYLAGSSNGGFMALRMMCVDAGSFAAIGLWISGMPETTAADCRPAKPIPVLMMKGTADKVVPHGGGLVANLLPVWPTDRLTQFLRQLNGCAGPAENSVMPGQQPQRIEIERSARCSGAPVVLYRIVGGEHVTPPFRQAGEVLLDFFADKSR
jgi:polyhydroxybutyrate depolymerase